MGFNLFCRQKCFVADVTLHIALVLTLCLLVSGPSQVYYYNQVPYWLLCPHQWQFHRNNLYYCKGETQGDSTSFALIPKESSYYLISNRGKFERIVQSTQRHIYNISYRGCSSFCSNLLSSHTAMIPDCSEDSMPKATRIADSETKQSQTQTRKETIGKKGQFDISKANNHKPALTVNKPITQQYNYLSLNWHLKLGHKPFKWKSSCQKQNREWILKLGHMTMDR